MNREKEARGERRCGLPQTGLLRRYGKASFWAIMELAVCRVVGAGQTIPSKEAENR